MNEWIVITWLREFCNVLHAKCLFTNLPFYVCHPAKFPAIVHPAQQTSTSPCQHRWAHRMTWFICPFLSVGQNGKTVLVWLVGKPQRGALENRWLSAHPSTDGGCLPTWKILFASWLVPSPIFNARKDFYSLLRPLQLFPYYSSFLVLLIIIFYKIID